MYILCHNKVLIVRHFLVRITYCTCVFVVWFVIMALHSLFFQTYLKEILKEICTYNMKAPHRNMWELKPEYRHYKEQQSSGWPSVTDQGQGRLHILSCSFDFSFQNFTKHHFHVYLHPSLDYKGVSRRFWDSATVIQVIVIKTWKNTRWFLFYYFIDFKKLVFFSTTVTNELEFSMCTS